MSLAASMLGASESVAALPGGTLDPTTIPKYVTPLYIPPEMPKSPTNSPYNKPQQATTQYNIAVRQFKQQILPKPLNPTPIWGYGAADDPVAVVAPAPASQSSFSYPAATIENTAGQATSVRWINELVAVDPNTGKPYPVGDKRRTFLPHVVTGSVDRNLHWANPEKLPCKMPTPTGTDCEPDPTQIAPNPSILAQAYDGPVPMVVHVHGVEVNSPSDGYSEAWWLPEAFDSKGKRLSANYAMKGKLYDQYHGDPSKNLPDLSSNSTPGSAAFLYENNQPATTLWLHDHTLGITRNNVYAGPAGFYLLRGGVNGDANVIDARTGKKGKLPGSGSGGRPTTPKSGGCDPNFDSTCRAQIREIPILLQDRSFNADGSLFYPHDRDFFDGTPAGMIPHSPDPASDIAPIYNPETFGNTIVANGATWPTLQVTQQRYRFRLLNGTDARALNMALYTIPPVNGKPDPNAANITNSALIANAAAGLPGWNELPFYQIGSDQGFLPKVVKIKTGSTATPDGNGGWTAASCSSTTPGPNVADPGCQRALLLAPAQRADAIVDFGNLAAGTVVRLVNTAPDEPFGGFPVETPSDEQTTGQVMQFEIGQGKLTDNSTPPEWLRLPSEASANASPAAAGRTRQVALMEFPSANLCVTQDAVTGAILSYLGSIPNATDSACAAQFNPNNTITDTIAAYAPKQTRLAHVENGQPAGQSWMDPITAAPKAGDNEVWEVYNTTVDAHPIHVHLVRFKVLGRRPMLVDSASPDTSFPERRPEPSETGFNDTVVALPGEVTRIQAQFVRDGLYMWHCHILEHEDHEMMVPFCSGNANDGGGNCKSPDAGANVPAVPVAPGI